VGVGYGAHDHAGFAEFGPLCVVPSVAELHRWLLENA